MRVAPIGFSILIAGIVVSIGNQQPPTIRTDVNLVQLDVSVTDSEGRVVTGLAKSAFRLFVDDAPQDISVFQGEDAPVTAGIVIDNSASMARKRQEVIAAALAFARASNPKDQMFVVHFNNAIRFGLPEGRHFTGDISELETAIAAFNLGGTTAFYDALVAAESHFKFSTYARKVLLTITDGGDNASGATLETAVNGARVAGIVIYPIGLFDAEDRDRNPAVLEELAAQTGGRTYFPEHVSDIVQTCVKIGQEIREQYTLGFAGATDGQYHRIRLEVSAPGFGPLKAHTRDGYLAVGPPGGASQ